MLVLSHYQSYLQRDGKRLARSWIYSWQTIQNTKFGGGKSDLKEDNWSIILLVANKAGSYFCMVSNSIVALD